MLSIVKPETGIEIWYSLISDLMDIVFSEKKYSHVGVKAQRSILFKENDFIPEFLSPEELETINGFKAQKKQIEWLAGRCLIKQMVQKFMHSANTGRIKNFDISQTKSVHSRETETTEITATETTEIDTIESMGTIEIIGSMKSKEVSDVGEISGCLSTGIKMCDINISHHEEGAPFFRRWPFLKISISHSGIYAAAAMCTAKEKELGLDVEKIGKMPDLSFMKIAFTDKEIADMKHCPEDLFKRWTIKEAFLKYIKKGFNESLHKVEILDGRIFYNSQKTNVSIFSGIIENQTGDRYSLSLIS